MTDEPAADNAAGQIATIENTMKSDYPAYARNPAMQESYLSALKTREAAGSPEPRKPTAVDNEIAQIEHRIKTDNRGYHADGEMQARYTELLGEQQREHAKPLAFASKPEAPPEAVSTELPDGHSGHGHDEFTALPTADVIANLNGAGPEMAAMVKAWGADAEANVAYMARESNEILNALPIEDALELEAAVEAMSPGAQVKLYRHLADAGRARRTR